MTFSFTFGATAQICAKTLKSEGPINFFSRTHVHRLLISHSTSFAPTIYNQVNESSLHSTNNTINNTIIMYYYGVLYTYDPGHF